MSTQDKTESKTENHQSPGGDGGEGGEDGEGDGGGVVVRVLVNGDREDTDQVEIPGEGNDQAGREEKEKSGPKAGKTKRKRPAHRCAATKSLISPANMLASPG